MLLLYYQGGTKTFTNSLGVQTLGDFIANKGGKDFNVLHTELGNDYRINTDTDKQLSPVFRPNGGWNASTNTPDLTVSTNKVNGNDYYVYYITATGTQNLGSGAVVPDIDVTTITNTLDSNVDTELSAYFD